MRRSAALAVGLGLGLTLSACSGSASDPFPSSAPLSPSAGVGAAVAAAATAVADPTAPAVPAGPCDKAAFGTHASLAIGAVGTYVWRPFTGGAFAASSTGRVAALKTASSASALAARELAAARTQIGGCPGAIILYNALTTGTSLAKAANAQFSTGKPVAETVAGVNSITGTVTAQAKKLAITVVPTVPTLAQLTAAG